jgi:hypothetical protein
MDLYIFRGFNERWGREAAKSLVTHLSAPAVAFWCGIGAHLDMPVIWLFTVGTALAARVVRVVQLSALPVWPFTFPQKVALSASGLFSLGLIGYSYAGTALEPMPLVTAYRAVLSPLLLANALMLHIDFLCAYVIRRRGGKCDTDRGPV